jgi:hypothetical protein
MLAMASVKIPVHLWALWEFVLFILACLSLYTMWKSWVIPISLLGGSTVAVQNDYWKGYRAGYEPWRWAGEDTSEGYWFEQTEDALAIMQDTYWNGTYWPSTIQWVGALINTIFASSETTFTNGLQYYNGEMPGGNSSASDITARIEEYYSQIDAYYDNEDTIQIFQAAYDDAQWVVLEWLEVIRFVNQYHSCSQSELGQENIGKYAHRAHIFYNIVQDLFDTSQCDGGLNWNPALETYKNAITNELFVSSSIAMYLYFPGDQNSDPYPHPDYKAQTNQTLPSLPTLTAHDPLFLENAKETWQWMKTHNFTNEQGLIVDGFHISDGQTTCDQRNEMVYTYNQGVVLTGLRGLWEATGDTTYLDEGHSLINTTINATGWNAADYESAGEWAGLGRYGIMEDYCDAPATCGQDNLIFKGAYFQHLDYFCKPLPVQTPLVADLTVLASAELASSHSAECNTYLDWIQHNGHAALSTRDESGIIGQWWAAPYVSSSELVTAFSSSSSSLTVPGQPNTRSRSRVHDAKARREPGCLQ